MQMLQAHESAACPYREKGQPWPGLHQQERSQHIEGSDSPSARSNFSPEGGKQKPNYAALSPLRWDCTFQPPLQLATRGTRRCERTAADQGLARVAWHNFCVLGGPKIVSHTPALTLLEATFASRVFPSLRHTFISQLLISSAVSIALCHLISIITPRIDILLCKSSRIPTLPSEARIWCLIFVPLK